MHSTLAQMLSLPSNSHKYPSADLNVVQTNATYQLEGLRAFEAEGVPVQFIELGNELFDVYQGGAYFNFGFHFSFLLFELLLIYSFGLLLISFYFI